MASPCGSPCSFASMAPCGSPFFPSGPCGQQQQQQFLGTPCGGATPVGSPVGTPMMTPQTGPVHAAPCLPPWPFVSGGATVQAMGGAPMPGPVGYMTAEMAQGAGGMMMHQGMQGMQQQQQQQ